MITGDGCSLMVRCLKAPSWLGPLSFLVLIEDLDVDCLIHKYVDDTTLTEPLCVQHQPTNMELFFHQLQVWANNNDMVVNFTKTKEIVMGPPSKKSHLPLLQLSAGSVGTRMLIELSEVISYTVADIFNKLFSAGDVHTLRMSTILSEVLQPTSFVGRLTHCAVDAVLLWLACLVTCQLLNLQCCYRISSNTSPRLLLEQ